MPVRLPLVALAAACLAARPLAAQAVPGHPLDGLTSPEIWTLYEVLREAGLKDSTTSVAEAGLHEPAKADVLGWRPGKAFGRAARVVLRRPRQTTEAIVDLHARTVTASRVVPGAQPTVTADEYGAASRLIKADPRVRAALARRGITDLTPVRCGGAPPAYFPDPRYDGRRILRGGCRVRHRSYETWSRQLEGLLATVDLDADSVLDVQDTGTIPPAGGEVDFDAEAVGAARAALPPIETSLPQGAGFRLEGGQVAWDRWRFHLRLDPRVGLVVSLATIADGPRERSVLYQGHLSEIFVPYQDSTTGWYDRTFLDVGEYSAEGILEPLEPGVDCPAWAAFLDGVAADADGLPLRRRRLACLFERTVGQVAWRHGDDGGDRVDGRPARELVVRTNATVGNYDYLFDWVFRRDGSIGVQVGATGILEVRVVQGTRAGQDDRHGRLLDRNVLGVNHDHFFSYRLDLDVDGPSNALAVGRLVRETLPAGHPRRSLWRVEESLARRESEAQRDMDMHRPETWRVVSSTATGPLGYPTSYEIGQGHNAMTLMSDDDWPQRRAGFSRHTLWVTPYRPAERFAAGDYPTLSTGPEGLPTWTRADRAIAGTDIVAWYTLGFHHVPRAEDWPVMPTAWHGFELRPFDFFPRNPALDLPAQP